MHTRREKFAKDIFIYISDICQNQLSDNEVVENRVFDVLGISKKDLQIILKKIVVALPDYIFLPQLPDLYNEVLGYLSVEYVLFQCQEDVEDPYFVDDLINFIYETVNTINQNYNYH